MHRVRRFLIRGSRNVVRIVRLQGALNARAQTPNTLNIRKVEKQLLSAFNTKKVKPRAVCLEINSPGGSAVQSNLIYQRIRFLAKENQIPVLAFAEDVAASGGYWLALAGDEIFVDPNSMIGSIGAISANFGMMDTIKMLGRYTNLKVHALLQSYAPLGMGGWCRVGCGCIVELWSRGTFPTQHHSASFTAFCILCLDDSHSCGIFTTNYKLQITYDMQVKETNDIRGLVINYC